MKKSKKTNKIVIGTGMLALTSILLWFGTFYFLHSETVKISSLTEEIKSKTKEEFALRSKKKLFEEVGGDARKLDDYFVSPDGIVNFISTIESLSGTAGVSVEIISVDTEDFTDKSPIAEKFNLNLRSEGSWNKIMHLISLVENLPTESYLSAVAVEKDKKSGNLWSATLALTAVKLK